MSKKLENKTLRNFTQPKNRALVLSVVSVLLAWANVTLAGHDSVPPNQPQRAQSKDKIPSLVSCDFLKRDKEASFLRQKWALDAGGIELLRSHPALKEGNFDSFELGIVDTGLKVKDNPLAGEKLRSASPEVEHGRHGTHVAGISASETFGVNPRLTVRAYPAKYCGQEGVIFLGGNNGFDVEDLLRQLEAAATNPKVGVINLSISSPEDPATRKILQEAIRRGKWIVYAGGNEGKVNSRDAIELKNFRNRPELFSVGALSYFSTPASFSNFGPNIKYWAYGAQIESLNAGYAPKLVDSEPSVTFSGTSMAAPHVSAVLATLRNLYPPLTAVQANQVLTRTQIRRYESPPVGQINAYHAVDLLWRTKKCLDSRSGDWERCLVRADKEIQAEIASLPELPAGKDCNLWEEYYGKLKRGYFLSDGSELFALAIRQFLDGAGKPEFAERIYFAGAGKTNEYVKEYRKQTGDSHLTELNKAVKFLEEPAFFDPASAQGSTVLKDSKKRRQILSVMPAELTNLDTFMAFCSEYFYEKPYLFWCERYLRDAENAFRQAVAERLLKADQPLISPDVVLALGLFDKPDIYGKLVRLAVRGWAQSAKRGTLFSLNELHRFEREEEYLKPEDFVTILNDFRKLRQNPEVIFEPLRYRNPPIATDEDLNEIELSLLLRCPADMIRGHEAELIKYLTHEGKDRLTGELEFYVRRMRSGDKTESQVIDCIGRLFDIARSPQLTPRQKWDRVGEYGDNHFITRALLAAINNPKIAGELAKRFTNEPSLSDGLHSIGSFPAVLQALLAKFKGAPEANQLCEALVNYRKSSSKGAEDLYDFLRSLEALPYASALLKSIRSKPQSDPVWQKVRQCYLAERLTERNRRPTPEDIAAFWREYEAIPQKKVFFLPRENIASNPEFRKIAMAELNSAKPNEPEVVLSWAMNADEKKHPGLADTAISHLAEWSAVDSKLSFSWIANRLGQSDTPDVRRMNAFFSQVEKILQDPRVSPQAVNEAVDSVSSLKKYKAWQRYLEERPTLGTALAQAIVREPDRTRIFSMSTAMKDVFVASMPDVNQLRQSNKGKRLVAPSWAADVIASDPRALPRALEYYAAFEKDDKKYIGSLIRGAAHKFPQVREALRKSQSAEIRALAEERS